MVGQNKRTNPSVTSKHWWFNVMHTFNTGLQFPWTLCVVSTKSPLSSCRLYMHDKSLIDLKDNVNSFSWKHRGKKDLWTVLLSIQRFLCQIRTKEKEDLCTWHTFFFDISLDSQQKCLVSTFLKKTERIFLHRFS